MDSSLNLIQDGANSLIYYQAESEYQTPVIIKVLKTEYPTTAQIIQFNSEYELTKSLPITGIRKAHAQTKIDNKPALILAYISGETLKKAFVEKQQPLQTFLKVAIAISHTLEQIHQHHIIHRDINTNNILVDFTREQVTVIDFGLGLHLDLKAQQFNKPTTLQGTLEFISPEQTARINRPLDYRTDLYALGITFYQMLTQQLPFPVKDPVELVHCHLAKQATPVHLTSPQIPVSLSAIVEKLMAKNAEDRYQSASGLAADLVTCLEALNQTGAISDFKLAENDISGKFTIPQKLYGRETEVSQLIAAFKRVNALASLQVSNSKKNKHTISLLKSAELTLISGHSGIGKTALVSEIYKPVVENHGYFIKGKFDQFQRDVPYLAIIEAFRNLVQQLLTESEVHLNIWRQKLLTALGTNGQVIIEIIPDIALIIGQQPPVPTLKSVEAQYRLNTLFQNFIAVFSQPEHPLVIFLDDLQWADQTSLKLIESLMTANNTHNLLLLGAYRHNEVDETHPLILTTEKIAESGTRVNTIHLGPLQLADIQTLLADTFNSSNQHVTRLAQLILTKTEGSPFFVSEFLGFLYQKGLIIFDYKDKEWIWNQEEIQREVVTGNVVTLVTNKIELLPPDTQDLLKLAACIGNKFDLKMLAIIGNESFNQTLHSLDFAIQEGIIIPLSHAYHLGGLDLNVLIDDLKPSYKFAHDQIQQAIYNLIPSTKREITHWEIGRRLLNHISPTEQSQYIFDLVNQLNQGRSLIATSEERMTLINLNLQAGQKAKSSAAYYTALHHFEIGIDLLNQANPLNPEICWEQNYNLALTLYTEGAEAAFVTIQFAQMALWIAAILAHAHSLLEKISAYEIKIRSLTTQNKMRQSLEVALSVLAQLGIKLPQNPTPLHIGFSFIQTRLMLQRKIFWQGKKIKDLIDLPEMTNPNKLASMRILSLTILAAFTSQPKLLPLIVLTMVRLSLKYGNTALSTTAYSTYGLILCGIIGDIEMGYEFGDITMTLIEHFQATELKARNLIPVYNTIKHWKDPIRDALAPMLEAHQIGMETGDIEFAAIALHGYTISACFSGDKLDVLATKIQEYTKIVESLRQEGTYYQMIPTWQFILNLINCPPIPYNLNGEVCNEEQIITHHEQNNDGAGSFLFYLQKSILLYLFEMYAEGVEYITITKKYIEGSLGLFVHSLFHFYDSLLHLAIFDNQSENQQQQILKQVTANQKKMKTWATHAPSNYLHKYWLVEAEKAVVSGEIYLAGEYYDKAISLAQENNYTNEVALSNERAGKFYFAQGRHKIAQVYLREAHYAYQQWGALTKVKDIETRYTQIFSQPELEGTVSTTSSTFSTKVAQSLDMMSLVKSAQIISGELVLKNLLQKMMHLVLENAGAERGLLTLKRDEEWLIEAELDLTDSNDVILTATPLAESGSATDEPADNSTLQFASHIVNYVIHTQKDVILDNAPEDIKFKQDPYIQLNSPKSILCTSLIKGGEIKGVIYLENNLNTGTFTPDRVTILKLLSSQMAISLDNALLYDDLQQYRDHLEELVTKRTQALSETLNDLQATQNQLIESEKMAALGNLVAGVAHEINTPVGIGISMASMLADETNKILDISKSGRMKLSALVNFLKTADESSNLILSSLNRIGQLVQSFKQVAVDQQSQQKRHFYVLPYLREVLDTCQSQLKNMTIIIEGNENLALNSYPGEFAQIITNLVANSLTHGYQTGQAGKLRFNISQEENYLVFEYTDDGQGISAENLPKIFNPFFTTASGSGGTGLGLHIVYNLVTQKFGGTIQCKSQWGQGATFILKLPL